MTALTIGRDPGCDIVLRDPSISRHHADVEGTATGEFRLRDSGSANGTFVIEDGNWVRIDVATVDGDEPVMFGDMQTTLAELIDPSQLESPSEANRDVPSERPSEGRSLAPRPSETGEIEEPKVGAGKPGGSTAQLVYILYVVNVIIPFTSIAGVIVAYVKRDEAAGTWVESHYTWQIRTFWIGLLFTFIGIITIFLYFIGLFILLATIVWYIARIVIGWQRLSKRETVRNPTSWFF